MSMPVSAGIRRVEDIAWYLSQETQLLPLCALRRSLERVEVQALLLDYSTPNGSL
jgi:hypothetical protein